MKSIETLVKRPPWRDELPRLRSFFRRRPLGPGAWQLQVLLADDPERIVGVVGVRCEGARAELRLEWRPGIENLVTPGDWLAFAREEASSAGSTELVCEAEGEGAIDRALEQAGFAESRVEELWEIAVEPMRARLQRILPRCEIPEGWSVRQPEVRDGAAIAKIVSPYGLLGARRIEETLRGTGPGGAYDLGLSALVESASGPIGVVLLKEGAGALPLVEIRAVAPEVDAQSGLVNLLLLQRITTAVHQRGLAGALLTINPARDRETLNFARRTGARRLQCLRQRRLSL